MKTLGLFISQKIVLASVVKSFSVAKLDLSYIGRMMQWPNAHELKSLVKELSSVYSKLLQEGYKKLSRRSASSCVDKH